MRGELCVLGCACVKRLGQLFHGFSHINEEFAHPLLFQ